MEIYKVNFIKSLRWFISIILLISVCMPTFIFPPQAYAGTMKWTVVDTPDSTNNVIASPSEINVIAVAPDGMTLFAIDISHSKLYRSASNGISWEDIPAS